MEVLNALAPSQGTRKHGHKISNFMTMILNIIEQKENKAENSCVSDI